MSRERWLIALIVVVELGALVIHPAASKAVMRAAYQFFWSITPKPEGFVPPDRFR